MKDMSCRSGYVVRALLPLLVGGHLGLACSPPEESDFVDPYSSAATTTIGLAADSHVRSGTASTNYGSASKVEIDADDGGSVVQAFVRFSIGNISSISNAKLRLYVVNGSNGPISVRRVSSTSWGETSITWNNKPAIDGSLIATIGATTAGTWVDVNVTSVAQPNTTVSLALVSGTSDGFGFSSRNASGNRPQVVIADSGGTGGSGGTAGTGGTGGTAGSGGTGGTGGAIIVATAGDIGSCSSTKNTADVAKVMQALKPSLFLALGDLAYPDGTATQFRDCYHNLGWGEFKSITRPSPGNHEYHSSGAAPYYDYFGSLAGPSGRGYYSFDQGSWHFVSLNGEVSMSSGSPQHQWLVSDLAANTKDCIVFYMHRALYASNTKHGSNSGVRPLYAELYKAGAEIALAGHDHYYERFAPQDPYGNANSTYGIRQFVVGNGGVGLYTSYSKLPNSQVINVTDKGVLKLTLGAGTYSWEFMPMAGDSLKDSGSGVCHGKP